ncbi:MAG TPA: hypothetical protein VGO80_22475 [Solirubrobacteraceae bacterium]|nr:hypothetical protein [Solirubrobacteraceae bacterium]
MTQRFAPRASAVGRAAAIVDERLPAGRHEQDRAPAAGRAAAAGSFPAHSRIGPRRVSSGGDGDHLLDATTAAAGPRQWFTAAQSAAVADV